MVVVVGVVDRASWVLKTRWPHLGDLLGRLEIGRARACDDTTATMVAQHNASAVREKKKHEEEGRKEGRKSGEEDRVMYTL